MRLHQLSGRLIVQRSDGSRTLWFVGGCVVHMASTLPRESMERTLVSSGAVTQAQIKWLRDRMGEDDDLGQSLMMMGALDAEKMSEHERFRSSMGVIAGVRESGASWRFEASPGVTAHSVDPELYSGFEPLSVVLESSRQRVDITQVLTSLSQDGGGKLQPTAEFYECFDLLEVPTEFHALPNVLRESASFEDFVQRMRVPVAPLAQLLWVLDSARVLQRGEGVAAPCPVARDLLQAWNRPPIALPLPSANPDTARTPGKGKAGARKRATTPRRTTVGSESAASSTATPVMERPAARATSGSGSAGRTRKATRTRSTRTRDRGGRGRASRTAVIRMVEGDHEHRLGRGPFGFLGVPDDANDETIARAASMLARRWRQAEQDDSLPDEARTKARELLSGVSIAKKLVSDSAKREAYLLRRDTTGALFITAAGLREGPTPAPRVTTVSSATSTSSGGANSLLDRAHALMAKNDFRSAVVLLKQAREQDPSSPKVFAALGWATWNEGGAGAAEDAEDYLRLALTFDARSIEALTYMVKMLLAQERYDQARPLVRMIVRLDADSSWAKRTMAELDARTDNANGTAS